MKVLGLLALIAAAAILMGIIVPGAIALKTKVFYQKDIQSIVDKKLADVKTSKAYPSGSGTGQIWWRGAVLQPPTDEMVIAPEATA